jgi:hypothetical protein
MEDQPSLPVDFLEQHAKELENSLGLTPGFFHSLLSQDDDWSFVIEAQALVEAGVTFHLVEAVGDARLAMSFAHLPLGGAAGKLAFAKALGILDRSQVRFALYVSRLRNNLVHDVRNVGFSLGDYVQGLGPEERKEFVGACTYFADRLDDAQVGAGFQQTATEKPRPVLWFGLLWLIHELYTHARVFGMDRKIEDLKSKIALLDDMLGGEPEET